MMYRSLRGKGAYVALALSAAALATSSAGHAVARAQGQVVAPAQEEQVGVADEEAAKHVGDGEASYYGKELAGNRTANGERFNPSALTAAHRTLPLGSKLRVINKANGKSVVVRINDRGPFTKHRLIDVSFAAAQEIGMIRSGKANVRLELLS